MKMVNESYYIRSHFKICGGLNSIGKDKQGTVRACDDPILLQLRCMRCDFYGYKEEVLSISITS